MYSCAFTESLACQNVRLGVTAESWVALWMNLKLACWFVFGNRFEKWQRWSKPGLKTANVSPVQEHRNSQHVFRRHLSEIFTEVWWLFQFLSGEIPQIGFSVEQKWSRWIKESVSIFLWLRSRRVKSKHPRDKSSMSGEWSGHNELPSSPAAGWWENPLYIMNRVFLCMTSAGMKRPSKLLILIGAQEVFGLRFVSKVCLVTRSWQSSQTQLKLLGIWFVVRVKVSHQDVGVGEHRQTQEAGFILKPRMALCLNDLKRVCSKNNH